MFVCHEPGDRIRAEMTVRILVGYAIHQSLSWQEVVDDDGDLWLDWRMVCLQHYEIVLFCEIFKGTISSYENAKLKYLLNYKQAYVCWFDTTNFNNSKIKRIIIESVGHMTFHG